MNTKYKHIVYTLFVSLVIPTGAQTAQDLQRAKSEYEKLRSQQSQDQSGVKQLENVSPITGLPREAAITPYSLPYYESKELAKKDLQHFGYDFFTQRDTVSFWENLPTPASYLLGPGDELIISLWGATQLREKFTITREGNIYDSKVGLLNLTGKTIAEARNYLNEQFGRVYSTLKGNNRTTFMDVSLGELRSINVNFVGQVNYPGVYPIHPFSTVITGLIQAGGVDTLGSLRKILISMDRY